MWTQIILFRKILRRDPEANLINPLRLGTVGSSSTQAWFKVGAMISSPFVKYHVNHKVHSKNRFSILLGVGVIIAISIKERKREGGVRVSCVQCQFEFNCHHLLLYRVEARLKRLSVFKGCGYWLALTWTVLTVSAQIERRRSINFYGFQAAYYGHFWPARTDFQITCIFTYKMSCI